MIIKYRVKKSIKRDIVKLAELWFRSVVKPKVGMAYEVDKSPDLHWPIYGFGRL